MMTKKIRKMNEISWLLGIVLCTLGVCLCTKANFGLSMIAAPPYIIHLRMVKLFPWYSQGTSEYLWQGILLIVLCIAVRRFRVRYLFSFLTAFLSGNMLDVWFRIFGGNGEFEPMWLRCIAYVLGVCTTALAIAFYFRTRLPLQVYELIVAEVSDKFGKDINKTKHIYDAVMLIASVVLAPLLNGSFRGVGIGTIITTVVNAPLIAFFGSLIDGHMSFEMRFRLPEALLR